MNTNVLDNLPAGAGTDLAKGFLRSLLDALEQSAPLYAKADAELAGRAQALITYTVIEYARTFIELAETKAPNAFKTGTLLRAMDEAAIRELSGETVH